AALAARVRGAIERRRRALRLRARIECDRSSAARTLRHPDRGQRAARVADEADIHQARSLPPCQEARQRTRPRQTEQGGDIRSSWTGAPAGILRTETPELQAARTLPTRGF